MQQLFLATFYYRFGKRTPKMAKFAAANEPTAIYTYIYIYVVVSKLGPKIAFFESKLGPNFCFSNILLSAGRMRFFKKK